jgi:hypothetical protein
MYASHGSYDACGLGSSGTDRLVELVREAERTSGLLGPRLPAVAVEAPSLCRHAMASALT